MWRVPDPELQRVVDTLFQQKRLDQDRYPPRNTMINQLIADSKPQSPLGSLQNWKPYIFEILEHFLNRELDLNQCTKLHTEKRKNQDEQQGQYWTQVELEVQKKWNSLSNKLYMIQKDEGQNIKSRTIQCALIITKFALQRLSQLLITEGVDYGLIGSSALRIALKNQSYSLGSRNFNQFAEYSESDLSQAQIFIVNTLDWKLRVPTPYEFIECLLYAINPDVEWSPFIALCAKVVKYCFTHYELSCNFSSTLAITAILIVSENYNFDDIDLETSSVEFQFAFLQHLWSSSLPIRISAALALKKQILMNLWEEDTKCKFIREAVRNHNELVSEMSYEQLLDQDETEYLTISMNLQEMHSIFADQNSLTFTICQDLEDIKLIENRESPSSLEGKVESPLQKMSRKEEILEDLNSTNPDSQSSNQSNYQLKSMKQLPSSGFQKRSFNLVKRIQDTMNRKVVAKKYCGKTASMPSSADQTKQHHSIEYL